MLKFLFLNILFLVLINSSFLINNYKTFNSIVPDNQSIYTQRNSIYSLNQFISNFSRNFSYQLITNVDPINNFNYRVVSKIHKLIKLDINDSRTTWPSQNYYSIFSHLYLIQSEDISPNFLLIILFIVSLVYILFNLKSTNKKILIITILNISGFLIFSFAIKWQPWHSRLLLPILIITNFTILEFLNKLPKIIKVLLITLLIYYSVPFYIKNQNRPLLNMRKNQIEQITSPRMNTTSTFLEFEKYYLKNRGKINQIGLIIGSDDYEFPFWFITKRDYNNSKVKIFHCFVNNGSKIYKNNCKNSDIYIFTKENLGLVKKIKKYNRIIKYDYFILIEI